MRKLMTAILVCFLSVNLFSQGTNQRFLDYIEKYKSYAVKEQYQHGIPASITMAQGLLESNAGHSMLAVKAKNHFGIKCGGNWNGKTVNKDDDNIQDCFRSYDDVYESFSDHSLFLKRSRYESLFKIPLKEYKAWAKELKRLGYATDPNYANKLIKIIEDYGLDKLVYESYDFDNEPAVSKGKSSRRDQEVLYSDYLTKTKNNGKTCYKLKKDATISEVATLLNNKNIKRLLYYNDMFEDMTLKEGTYVYVSKKRSKGDKDIRSYYVKEGDSMHSISQYFGITLKALYKLNGLEYGAPAKKGMILFLQ